MTHYYGVHLKIKSFSCKKCEMSFAKRFSAERHVKGQKLVLFSSSQTLKIRVLSEVDSLITKVLFTDGFKGKTFVYEFCVL